ncbi:MAG: hypothetical protein RL596_881 [Bacteroidota bacterium]|jgi:hypothetical protein
MANFKLFKNHHTMSLANNIKRLREQKGILQKEVILEAKTTTEKVELIAELDEKDTTIILMSTK